MVAITRLPHDEVMVLILVMVLHKFRRNACLVGHVTVQPLSVFCQQYFIERCVITGNMDSNLSEKKSNGDCLQNLATNAHSDHIMLYVKSP